MLTTSTIRRLLAHKLRAIVSLIVLMFPAVAFAQSETIEYYGLDALGSVRAIFDQQGNPVARMDYGPFGENLKAAIKFPIEQFAQLARNPESGQDYAEARNYSPDIGRFNRADAIYAGLFAPQAWNRYAYAINNPITFVDPTGLVAEAQHCSWTETVTEDGLVGHLSCLSEEMRAFLNGGRASPAGSTSGTRHGGCWHWRVH